MTPQNHALKSPIAWYYIFVQVPISLTSPGPLFDQVAMMAMFNKVNLQRRFVSLQHEHLHDALPL